MTLVRTHIWAYKKADNKPCKPTASASSPSEITDRLLYILQQTPETIDFLFEAVNKITIVIYITRNTIVFCFISIQSMWGLRLLELYFLAVSQKYALDQMTQCVLQKVDLVEVTPATPRRPREINLDQLKCVQNMLIHIQILMKLKRPMNVRQLIVALYAVSNTDNE